MNSECQRCDGSGRVEVHTGETKYGDKYISVPCQHCNGTGIGVMPAPTPPQGPAELADRDAAADLLDELSSLLGHNGLGQVADLIRAGEYDEHDALKAFHAHRLAGRDEGLRRAAEVAQKAVTAITIPAQHVRKAIIEAILAEVDQRP